MSFRAYTLTAFFALTPVGSVAYADPEETEFYGSVFVEGDLLQSLDFNDTSADVSGALDPVLEGGFAVGGALGRSWSGLGGVTPRTELELSYREGASDALGLGGFGPVVPPALASDSVSTTLVGKVMLDVPIGESVLTPYLGAGVGIKFKDKGFTSGNGLPLAPRDEDYSAQVMAGVSHSLAEQLDLTLDGRYQRTLDKDGAALSPSGDETKDDEDLGIFSLFIRLSAKF